MSKTNNLLMLLAALIIVAPLAWPGIAGSFNGSDALAQAAIDQSGYTPWFTSIWQPPSKEIESLLFALQAALGAGLFGYVLGRRHGVKKPDDAA
jgi:cobalt/nickel transport protein